MRTPISHFVAAISLWGLSSSVSAQTGGGRHDSLANTGNPASVQKVTNAVRPKPPKPAKTECSIGLRLNSNGWSVFTDYGTSKPIDEKHAERFFNLHFFQFEVTEKKDPRQVKTSTGSSATGGSSSSYIYGKINNFYVIKLGYGVRTMIAGKPDEQGTVSIHWINAGGAAIGLLKPYYVNIGGLPVKYNPVTATEFLDPQQITGSAGFSTGLGETVIVPGVHYKTGFHFDIAGSLKTVIAIETGANVEYYFQSVALMASKPPTNLFADVYLSFQFGKRW